MLNRRKRIAILVMVLALLFAKQAMAQTKVIGFQLGKTSYNEVKANLPDGVQITRDKGNAGMYGGPMIWTEGIGFGIEGLERVSLRFDQEQTLVEVEMIIEERRFNNINKILTSKYRPMRSDHPKSCLLFKANRDYIYLYLPWDKSFTVAYMTPMIYQKDRLAKRQTIEHKKAEELRNKKALEEEAMKERDKF